MLSFVGKSLRGVNFILKKNIGLFSWLVQIRRRDYFLTPFFEHFTPYPISDPFTRSIICLVELLCDPCHGSGAIPSRTRQSDPDEDRDGINKGYGPVRSIAIPSRSLPLGCTSPFVWVS
jgi:hypothetical protein